MTIVKNPGRQLEFDFIKVFAIFFMILIHLFEHIPGTDFHTSPNGTFTHLAEFLGGPLAAPVFMIAMGVGMVYSRKNSAQDFINRSWKLMLMGYFLNFLRSVLPILLANLFLANSDKLQVDVSDYSLWNNLMNVDILVFAGMTFLLIGLLKNLGLNSWKMLLVSLVMLSIGMCVGKVDLIYNNLEMLTGIFFYSNSDTFFPLFLWFPYPIIGMIFGEILQQVTDKKRFYQNVFTISLVSFITVSIGQITQNQNLLQNFTHESYPQQTIFSLLWIIPIVFMAISLMYFFTTILTHNKIVIAIKFIGSNLNQLYIIHWILIPYIVGFTHGLSNLQVIGLSLFLMVICILIRFTYLKMKSPKNNN